MPHQRFIRKEEFLNYFTTTNIDPGARIYTRDYFIAIHLILFVRVGSELKDTDEKKKEKPYTMDVLASTTMNDAATCDKL